MGYNALLCRGRALMLAATNCALINQESWRVGRLCGLCVDFLARHRHAGHSLSVQDALKPA